MKEESSDPLQNDLILRKIFQRLNIAQDQKEFRLVHPTWESASLVEWRRSAFIRIDMNEEDAQQRKHGMEDFLKFWNEATSINDSPYRRFILQWKDWKNATDEDNFASISNREILGENPLMEQFWERCSPKMEHLQLQNLRSKKKYNFVSTMKWILLEGGRKNLKSLSIIDCHFFFREDLISVNKGLSKEAVAVANKLTSFQLWDIRQKNPEYSNEIIRKNFHEFFHLVPNLKELSFHSDNLKPAMQALDSSTRTMEKPIKIVALDLKLTQGNEEGLIYLLKYLNSSQTDLKSLKLDFSLTYIYRAYPNIFNQVMVNTANTLNKLEVVLSIPITELNDFWITHFTGITFPHLTELIVIMAEYYLEGANRKFDFRALWGMKKLKRFICISRYKGSMCKKTENENNILDHERLSVRDLKFSDEADGDGESKSLDNLEEFHFRLLRNFNVKSLKKVAGWMPNLRKVGLVLDNETFQGSLKFWRNLEELTLLEGSRVSKAIIEKARTKNKFIRIINCASAQHSYEEGKAEKKKSCNIS